MVEAEWPTYRAGSSKEEKKETSNVAHSMIKTWWSRSDDTNRAWYEYTGDAVCRRVFDGTARACGKVSTDIFIDSAVHSTA